MKITFMPKFFNIAILGIFQGPDIMITRFYNNYDYAYLRPR